MQSHFEESLRQDIALIRGVVVRMGGLAEDAFRTAIQALERQDRHLAETVILKDRYIDELESELDWLCLRFLVKHQPAAGHLRLAYSIIKINNQLERTGDYAESIARQFLVLSEIQPQPLYDPFIEIAELAIKMLHNAVQAFADNDTELAVQTRAMEKDRTVDRLRSSIHDDLIRQHKDHTLPSEALVSLMTIANRTGAMVLATGNKSELSVGYCTLYGDMCGGLAPLGDVSKRDVYAIAVLDRFAGRIPPATLEKPPSAELAPDQRDEDSLPPYDQLDAILKSWVEDRQSITEIQQQGNPPAVIEKVIGMIELSEHKRRQSPPILRISSKAFGIGRRVPIARSLDGWQFDDFDQTLPSPN